MTLRAATAADQPLIRQLVRAEHLNPLGLAWQNFLIAEDPPSQQILGMGQLRPHKDGTVELASLVVMPDARGKGVGSLLANALIAKADRPLYLMCERGKVPYYQRFGFVDIPHRRDMPRSLRPMHHIATAFSAIVALFQKDPPRIAIMAYRGSSKT